MGKVSMPQGKGSQLHNRREYEKIGKPIPDNIDSSKTAENITLVDRGIRQVYQEIFGDALEQYNSKQKRADRKIEDYYDHIQKSKNGEKLFYEDVVQWGKKEDFQKPETRERAKEALVKYVEGFEERNPNLKLIYKPYKYRQGSGYAEIRQRGRLQSARPYAETRKAHRRNSRIWSEMGERRWFPRHGRGYGKAYRYQQRHCRHDRATSPSNLSWLGYGTLNSGFRGILAETAERKTKSFLFRRWRRNNPKKTEVKGFEGWRFA